MARQNRIVLPGELYHLTQRGNYRQTIFEEEMDRAYYLKLFEEYKNKYGLELIAFCLMTNHVHFIVRPLHEDSIAQTICRCHQRYAVYMHRKKELTGHLWQGRYFACLLYGDHIKSAIRYVERNPVRANIVAQPWDYHWSSAKAHLGVKYKIITLVDYSQYVEILDWKKFLTETEDEERINQIRISTAKGRALGTKIK